MPVRGAAIELVLPPATRQTIVDRAEAGTIALPAGPWRDGDLPVETAEGTILRRAWRLPDGARTTSQILAPLRDQIRDAGYEIAFECADERCGGFDFRFAANVLGAPEMYVDLGDFRYLLAERGTGGEPLSLMVSRAPDAGFVQLTEVLPDPAPAVPAVVAAPDAPSGPRAAETGASLWDDLVARGHAALDDLAFAAGSAALGATGSASLAALAEGLGADPAARIVLVGHTDDEGGLAANLALSRRRAQSVRRRLIDDYGVAPSRLSAEGVGFLAPRRSNATPDGRLANRRVEAVLLE